MIRNNIVQGFETGMQIDNDLMNTNVSHNALWNISGEQYTGTALAPLIGEQLSFNANSDSSDVYGNIYMDPLFVGAGFISTTTCLRTLLASMQATPPDNDSRRHRGRHGSILQRSRSRHRSPTQSL